MALVVLLTGCSSGIGKALCWAFHRKNYRVIATARRQEAMQDLQAAGMRTLPLDVTDAAAVQQTVDTVLAAAGRIDILVNNAGFGQFGPLLDLTEEQVQRQFQTNVFAPLSIVQKVAPVMKMQGSGLIVNIGSISGIVTTPFAGAYCASKAALHSMSEALRLELSPFGIDVVTVQPGAVASCFGQSAENSLSGITLSNSWYGDFEERIRARAVLSQQDATPPADFAVRLVDKVTQPHPPSLIRLGRKSLWLPLLKLLLPARGLEFLLKRRFGL